MPDMTSFWQASIFVLAWIAHPRRLAARAMDIQSKTTTTTLFFDGSLRPPRDFGFPKTANMAAAGAAIYRDDELIAVGASSLSVTSSSTSAISEYLALSFGLEYLMDRVDAFGDGHSLVICGDCKTVLDQLGGRSMPRKLTPYHKRTTTIIKEIQSRHPGLSVGFRHVPRRENALCDGLCSFVMDRQCQSAVEDAMRTLESMEEDIDGDLTVGSFLHETLDHPSSLIPFSQRPQMYERLSVLSRDDPFVFMDVANAYAGHAQDWKRHNKSDRRHDGHVLRATELQLEALERATTTTNKSPSHLIPKLQKKLELLRKKSRGPKDGLEENARDSGAYDSLAQFSKHDNGDDAGAILCEWVDSAGAMEWSAHDSKLWIERK